MKLTKHNLPWQREGEAMEVYDATKDTPACASGVVKTGRRGQFYCNFIGFYEPIPTNAASSGNFGALCEIMVWRPPPKPSARTHRPKH